ncbi:Diacetylchitobiose uptake system permease protein DasC [subsurface metagenome]
MFALILTHDNEAKTVAVQLYNIATVQFAAGQWGGIMAESIIFTIPVVVIFVILQKNLVEGLTGGAVKF